MMIYLVTAMITIVTAGLWGYARFARWDLERLSALESCLDQFFNCATKFAENEKTPYLLLKDIQELNGSLNDPRMPAKLLYALENISPRKLHRQRLGSIVGFLHREQFASIYREMATSYILLISYKDMIYGRRIRNLLNSVGKSELRTAASSNLEDTPAVDVVDELLTAEHGARCPARG